MLVQLPYNEWSLAFLIDYITNTHHSYVKKTLPDLVGYAHKVANVHGGQHPELLTIRDIVNGINAELSAHMVERRKSVISLH